MSNVKESKQGFVLYRDTLKVALELIPDMSGRGELLTNIYYYVSDLQTNFTNDIIFAAFKFIENGINNADEKFQKEKKRRTEYYKNRYTKNTENTENTNNTNKTVSVSKTETVSVSKTETESVSKTETDTDTDTSNNDIKNNINISLSNKYTKKEVKEILEKEGFFLKNMSFDNFFTYNSKTAKWQYEPLEAVKMWVERHPDCLSTKHLPPQSVANLIDTEKQKEKKFIAAAQLAENTLAEISAEISPNLNENEKRLVNNLVAIKQGGFGLKNGKFQYKLSLKIFDKVLIGDYEKIEPFMAALERRNITVDWIY